jgi:hypothetical protein
MKPNPAQKQLPVAKIAAGLVELEKFLGIDPTDNICDRRS